jgi:type I restriction enzyme, R subunit
MNVFNEATLEQAIIELFQKEEYQYTCGIEIHKEVTDVLLRDDLHLYLSNHYSEENITSLEIETAISRLEANIGQSVYENNAATYRLITEGFSLKREDSSVADLYIKPIDFNDGKNNIFRIVNQLEIKGTQKRIPDGIVYINGLPMVVLEFKSAIKENTTIMDAYTQLTVRYRRDIPDLFKYNAFVVISDGVNNKYGSLHTPYDFFYSWRKIDYNDTERDGISSLYTMVRGMFRKERLLNIIKDFVFFPDSSKKETKIVCRYPQYFATQKLFDNIALHSKILPIGDGKGGTYFGATGCGKSYTMLFLTRMLMRSKHFCSPTIILITDRTDLDDQLSAQFVNAKNFIGDECVVSVESREKLREWLSGRNSGGVFLTTIQKFTEDTNLLSDRANIICISDEAHRSQTNLEEQIKITEQGVKRSFGFAKYLHDSFPNGTFVGFTGTPVDATLDVFGKVVDAYTMTESVRDGITRKIVYEGRAAKVQLNKYKLAEIEDYYTKCAEEGASEYQIESSKQQSSRIDIVLDAPERLQALAKDLVTHYENRVNEGSTVLGKAMVVCANRTIAYDLYKLIILLRPGWAEKRIADKDVALTEKEKQDIIPLEKIKLVMTRNKDDEKELWELLGADEIRKKLDLQFKNVKSNFKIAIVVDMWITGFDVPSLDTMYIDKPLQQHTLIQTISRVNRVYEGKDKGLIVDYIGIKSAMNIALKHYANGNTDETTIETIEQSVTMVLNELDILRRIFHKFDYSAFTKGTPLEQLDCLNKSAEFIQSTKEQENLFMGHTKKLKSAYDICCNSNELSINERDDIHFFTAIRSIVFKLTKGNAPDASKMNKRVAKMIEEAIQSEGVEEIIKIGEDTATNLDVLGDEYMARIQKLKLPNTKVKLMEQLLKRVINEFKKVNKIKGVDFSKRLNDLIEQYNNRKDNAVFADEVLTEVASRLADLYQDIVTEKKSFENLGISYEEKAFYDILKAISVQFGFEYAENKLVALSKEVKKVVDDKSRYTDWASRNDIKDELKMDLILLLAEYDYPPVTNDEVFKEIFEQAENFKKYNE